MPRSALVVLALVLLAGCGQRADVPADGSAPSRGADSPGAADPAPSAPTRSPAPSTDIRPAPASWRACDDVWRDGATLPARYAGCSRAGSAVRADVLGCSSGQRIVLYADHYFAVAGGLVRRTSAALPDSPRYAAAVATCRG